MLRFRKCIMVVLGIAGIGFAGKAQSPEVRIFLKKDSTAFVKLAFANQAWVRYAQNNPGSTINQVPQAETFDIGLRRTRLQLYGRTSAHTFFYLQMGQNNFNYLSSRKSGFFIHDALGEIIIDRRLAVCTGLTAWTGFSRYSSPSVASIMALDAPLFLQATNDANDQFLRKLSVYAKGKLGRLDYRLIASKPFMFTTSGLYSSALSPDSAASGFSPLPPLVQTSGYFSYQFRDEESNETPYQVGTYLGKKKVLNVGTGFQYQQDAMWYEEGADTLTHDMLLLAFDVYYDSPLNTARGNAISIYAVATYYDFGKNYLRNLGPMNTADGMANNNVLNGAGVAFPMIGTGNSAYIQAGYLTGEISRSKQLGKLMPYLSAQYSQYEGLKDPLIFVDAGCSWYVDGARSKLTFAVQNRPVYDRSTLLQTARLSSFILQYQVSI